MTSFADRWKAASAGNSSVFVMQQELVKYRDEIYAIAVERSKLEWDASGLTTYGGLAAVFGALADRTGLLNTGAAVATIGLTNSSRYQFHQQTQIYLSALRRLACITGKVNATSDISLTLAMGSDDLVAVEAAKNFAKTVVNAVDFVRTEYTNSLFTLSPGVPSRDELLGMIATYRPASKVNAAPDPQQLAKNQAGEVVKALAAEVQTCSKI